MKRCPHCEFIYEDDQSHCDMDGTKLAHDSRALPKLQALSATDTSSESRWKGRAVPVFASATLVIVLGLVYFVSTRLVAHPVSDGSTSTTVDLPANITSPSPTPTVPEETSLAIDTPPPAEANKETPAADEGGVSIGGAPAKPVEQRVSKPNVSRNTKPAQQAKSQKDGSAKGPSEKDDSKMRSILKKTGRFFKKTLPL